MTAQVINLFETTQQNIESLMKRLFPDRDIFIIVDHFLHWADFDYKEKKKCVEVLFQFQKYLKEIGTDLISFGNYTIEKSPISSQKRIICEFFIDNVDSHEFETVGHFIGLFSNCLILKRTNGITIREKTC